MLYNENILYNSEAVVYSGEIILNIEGVHSPIRIPQATVIFGTIEDYSNVTTIGLISIDTDPYGIMTFSTTDAQADAIIQAETIIVSPNSEVSIIYSIA